MKATMEERGWPGHFICADRCLFRRNTLVTLGERRVVVSTVGAMRDQRGVPTTVGSGRYYETMAFKARQDEAGYWDADTSWEFCIEGRTSLSEWTTHSDREANDMHNAAVAEVAARLEQDYREPWSAPLTRHST